MAISQSKTNHKKLTQVPSKLRKAIGVVKDQTSLRLAKVSITTNTATSNGINLEIAILKATSHHETPTEDPHVASILRVIASDRGKARMAARAIGRRVGKSRNWVVTLKSLALVLRAFQEADPHFPKEVRHVMSGGTKILNLSGFRDDSNPRPWDFASFVRAFALYLDGRLECQLSDRLPRRPDQDSAARRAWLSEMTTEALIDRVTSWQRLLDKTVATKPLGAAIFNRLVQASLYTIVQESFVLHEDVSDGLGLLLDGYFDMPYQSCVDVFHACARAAKQFEDLSEFYRFCQNLPLGRTSDYPSVRKISAELVETLQDFLKDRHVPSPAEDCAPTAPDCSEPTDEPDAARQLNSLNPFLEEASVGDVAPTFCARNPDGDGVDGECNDDPFESRYWGEGERGKCEKETESDEGRKSLEEVKQLWLENQKKIITKHMGR